MPKKKLKPHDPLKAARQDPKKVKSIVLNPAHLRNKGFDSPPLPAFPLEILECKNLESLEIFRGLSGRDESLPEDFGRLTKLESLSLGGIDLKKLPDSIGKLKKLKKLELNYLEKLTELPDAIGECTSLESIEMYEVPKLKSLPKTIGKLKKLKSLKLVPLKNLPDELFTLPNLESLEIDPRSLVGHESKLAGLKKLKKLNGVKPEIPDPKLAAPAKKHAPTPKKRPDPSAPTRLAHVASGGELLVGDARSLTTYAGPKSPIVGQVVRVSLGPASVWIVDNGTFVLVDDKVKGDDETLHAFVNAKPAKNAKKIGAFEIDDGHDDWLVAIVPSNEASTDLAKLVKQDSKLSLRPCGAKKGGVLMSVVSTEYDVLVEPGRVLLVSH